MAFNAGSVFVRLGADLDRRGFEQFEREHVKAQHFKDVKTRLGGDFERREFDLYQRKLDEVRARVAKRDAFKATLGGDYNAQAFRAYERDLRRAERDTVQSTGRMRTAFGAVYGRGGALFAAAGGIYGLQAALKSVVSASGDAEVSQAKLRAQLKASGISYDEHAKQIDKVIQATSKLSGLDDEDLQDAFTNIIRVTGDVDKSLRLTGLAADFARAKHMDVAKAGELVGKVAGGNIGILSRYGVVIDKGASSTEALAALQKRFGGQAESYGKTQQGALDRVGVSFENLRETIGVKLQPTITEAADKLAKFIDQMQSGEGAGGKFVDALERVWKRVKEGFGVLRDIGGFLKDHIKLVEAAAGAWLAFKGAIVVANGVAKGSNALAILTGGRAGTRLGTTAAGAGAAAATGRGGGRGGLAALLAFFGIQLAGEVGDSRGNFGLPTTGNFGSQLGRGVGNTFSNITSGRFLTNPFSAGKDPERDLRKFGDAVQKTVKEVNGNLALLSPRKLVEMRDKARDLADQFPKYGDALKGFAGQIGDALESNRRRWGRTLDQTNADVDAHFRQMARDTKGHLHDIRVAVGDNTTVIKTRLGTDTAAGRAAMAHNFEEAADAVRRSMRAGVISTKTGTQEIRRLMVQALKSYGLTESQAEAKVDHGTLQSSSDRAPGGGGGRRGAAGGGFIGLPGQAGPDEIPIVVGAGEAVLNRHQQAVIEGLLGQGFLDQLFATVDRPHYMARGGYAGGGRIVPVPGFPGERAAASVVPQIELIARRFGLTLTDAFGQGHKSPGHTRFGTAADFAGPDRRMDAAVKYLVGQGYLVGYDGRFGSRAWPGHGPSSVAGANAHFHVELGSGGGGGGLGLQRIGAPRVRGGGAVGSIVQRALDVTTAAANTHAQRVADALTGSPVAGGGGGGFSKSKLRSLWVQAGGGRDVANLMAAIALAESGGRAGIVNSIGAGGLWQIHPPEPGYLDPLTNARIAVRKYRTQGLRAWEAYTNGSYRQFLGRGGFARRFAGGGFVRLPGFVTSALNPSVPRVTSVTAQPSGGTGGSNSIKGLPRLQQGRSKLYDQYIQNIDDLNKRYSVAERRYNLSDEELVRDDGSVDEQAVNKRVQELASLESIRARIVDQYHAARRVIVRMINTYKTIITRLSNSLEHAKGKDRSGVRRRIRAYQQALGERRGVLHDIDTDLLPNARLDLQELTKERLAVAGTQGSTTAADTLSDVTSEPGPSDQGVSPDAQAQIDQANQNAAAATKNYQALQQFVTTAFGPGDIGAGGVSALAAAGGPTIIVNTLHPGDPDTLRAIGDAATSGQSLQPSVTTPRYRVGV